MKPLPKILVLVTLCLFNFWSSNIVGAVYHFRDEKGAAVEVEPPLTTQFGRPVVAEENPTMWSTLEDIKKKDVDPKLGTELTQIYNNYVQRQTEPDAAVSASSSVENEMEYVLLDMAFTTKLDKEEAREILRPVVEVDFIECFVYMCSVRIPVSALKDVAQLDAVRVLHLARGMTHS